MLNKTLALLLVFSLAFNIAFLAIWARGRRARAHDPGPPPQEIDQPEQQRRRPDGPRTRGPGGDALWEDLGVSDEQKKLLNESREDLWRKSRALDEEARTHREQLYKLLESELPDEEAVLAEQDAIGRLEQQQRRAVVEQMLEMRRILKPDQRKVWLEKLREMRERMHRRGRFGRGRRTRGSDGEAEPGPGPEGPDAMPPGGPPEGGPPPRMPQGGET